jgi:outer membrane beta-barrel protein
MSNQPEFEPHCPRGLNMDLKPAHRPLLLAALCSLIALTTIVPRSARADDAKSADKSKGGDKDKDKDKKDNATAASANGEGASASEEEETKKTNKIPTLEDRIKPVSGNLFVAHNRFEAAVGLDLSLNDPFFQKYMLGLKGDYHITDWLAVGARLSFGISASSGNVDVCKSDSGCSAPSKNDLVQTPGDISMIAGLDVAWSPLYGKVNLFGERVLHFDTFAVAGLDTVRFNVPTNDPSVTPTSTFAFGGHFGVGQHYIINEFVGVRVDLRDYLYSGQRDVNGAEQGTLENQLMLEIGVSFFFPLHPDSDS